MTMGDALKRALRGESGAGGKWMTPPEVGGTPPSAPRRREPPALETPSLLQDEALGPPIDTPTDPAETPRTIAEALDIARETLSDLGAQAPSPRQARESLARDNQACETQTREPAERDRAIRDASRGPGERRGADAARTEMLRSSLEARLEARIRSRASRLTSERRVERAQPVGQRHLRAARPLEAEDLEQAAANLGCGAAELWAVAAVESHGVGFDAERLPTVLYERHFFSRLTHGAYDAQAPIVSNPRWGGYGPALAEWERIGEAAQLDYDAALKSAAWGLGQVMGAQAEALGYPGVRAFVARMRRSEAEQLDALVRYIETSGLARRLRNRDWSGFARIFYGPSAPQDRYDRRLAEAYRRFSDPDGAPDWTVRRAQLCLCYLGFIDPLGVDGALGRKTRAALATLLEAIGWSDVDLDAAATIPAELAAVVEAAAAGLPEAWPPEGLEEPLAIGQDYP